MNIIYTKSNIDTNQMDGENGSRFLLALIEMDVIRNYSRAINTSNHFRTNDVKYIYYQHRGMGPIDAIKLTILGFDVIPQFGHNNDHIYYRINDVIISGTQHPIVANEDNSNITCCHDSAVFAGNNISLIENIYTGCRAEYVHRNCPSANNAATCGHIQREIDFLRTDENEDPDVYDISSTRIGIRIDNLPPHLRNHTIPELPTIEEIIEVRKNLEYLDPLIEVGQNLINEYINAVTFVNTSATNIRNYVGGGRINPNVLYNLLTTANNSLNALNSDQLIYAEWALPLNHVPEATTEVIELAKLRLADSNAHNNVSITKIRKIVENAEANVGASTDAAVRAINAIDDLKSRKRYKRQDERDYKHEYKLLMTDIERHRKDQNIANYSRYLEEHIVRESEAITNILTRNINFIIQGETVARNSANRINNFNKAMIIIDARQAIELAENILNSYGIVVIPQRTNPRRERGESRRRTYTRNKNILSTRRVDPDLFVPRRKKGRRFGGRSRRHSKKLIKEINQSYYQNE